MPATSRQDYLAGDLRAGLPVVFVDRKPAGVDADSVSVDNVEGGLLATNHLLTQGHRRVAAILDNISIPTAEQRRRGYFKAHAARGVSPDPELIVTEVRDSLPDATSSPSEWRGRWQPGDCGIPWPWWGSTTSRWRTCSSHPSR